MIFSGNQIVCENCKSIISSCTDQAVLNHIQKKCERRTQTERKKVVVIKNDLLKIRLMMDSFAFLVQITITAFVIREEKQKEQKLVYIITNKLSKWL